jgi:nitrogen fixation-related uncharacterized protein
MYREADFMKTFLKILMPVSILLQFFSVYGHG